MENSILVVDDERFIRESLSMILSPEFSVTTFDSGGKALSYLRVASENKQMLPKVILLDVMMPGVDGIEVLKQVRTEFPAIQVIMLSASKTVKNVVQAMKIGAVDYINKPFEVEELLNLIRQAAQNVISVSENVSKSNSETTTLVGKHPLMLELFRKLEQVSKRDTTVMITGESGTGKEIVAREIHCRSHRSEKNFVAINCAAIPETLIESELFGHEKGAFTNAVESRTGYFELADGGTLFLDEIGELSLPVQVKVLRFLQEREFYRVGSSKPMQVDVRIIVATNRNLEEAVLSGSFRQDLFYRINVVSLHIPPLRERKEDISELVSYFLRKLGNQYNTPNCKMDDRALSTLINYNWPGNVRELENIIESILALSSATLITENELPSRLFLSSDLATKPSAVAGEVLQGKMQFEQAEQEFERELIIKALEKSNYVQTRAAELLGITRRILKYKMDKLGIPTKKQPQI